MESRNPMLTVAGVDLIHNPEFLTCEFYEAYANLEDLIGMTERMLAELAAHLREKVTDDPTLPHPAMIDFNVPYKRIDFIPHIESALGSTLPPLGQPGSTEMVRTFLRAANIDAPDSVTLPQMLDQLSATFIEPHCTAPTFIVHHPECLSPLAKSFEHPDNGQMVAARAELFVKGHEIINTYEEENSPIEQRRKFQDQLRFAAPAGEGKLDENYLEALEWGLPPTGGWGGGIERLCMLMAGANRIGDVLSFGTLRNVVALGRGVNPRH